MTTLKQVAELLWAVVKPFGAVFLIFAVGRLYQRFTHHEHQMEELRMKVEKLGDLSVQPTIRVTLTLPVELAARLGSAELSSAHRRWSMNEPLNLSADDAEIINPRRTQ